MSSTYCTCHHPERGVCKAQQKGHRCTCVRDGFDEPGSPLTCKSIGRHLCSCHQLRHGIGETCRARHNHRCVCFGPNLCLAKPENHECSCRNLFVKHDGSTPECLSTHDHECRCSFGPEKCISSDGHQCVCKRNINPSDGGSPVYGPTRCRYGDHSKMTPMERIAAEW